MITLPADSTYYFYRGRVALYALLRGLGIESGDEILIPGFTCVAVPSPILGLRAKPVYVDIDPTTYNMTAPEIERKLTPRTRVIVAQHTFGIPCDMDPIMEIASKYNLTVIEDTCHVWGSRYKGKDLGSIGAAAFYSYDPGKPFIIGMGGAATSNSELLTSELRNLNKDFKNSNVLDTTKLHIQYFAYRLTRSPRLFWRIRDLYRFLSKEGVAIATWTPDSLEGNLGPDYAKGLAPSLQRRLNAMVRRGNTVIARHKRLFAVYDRGLREMGFSGLNIRYACDPVLICYPIQVAKKANLLEEARRERVELGDWFSSPVHPLTEPEWKSVEYTKGTCPIAEKVSKQIITLPCHAGVTQKEAQRTLAFLAKMQTRGLLEEVEATSLATTQVLTPSTRQ